MKTRTGVVILAVLIVCGISVFTLLSQRLPEQQPALPVGPYPGLEPGPSPYGTLEIKPVDLSGIGTEKLSFTKYYSLAGKNVELKVPQYSLPLNAQDISNYADFSTKIDLNTQAEDLLKKNGFVVIGDPFYGQQEYITNPYETLKDREVPIFITSDSLLHLYHIQFDETLRQIEEREFFDAIWGISKSLFEDSAGKYNSATGELKEALKRNAAYFAVGLESLKPTEQQLCVGQEWECMYNDAYFTKEELEQYTFETPGFIKDLVDSELALISAHAGFSKSPIFNYDEDYSQYIPRGHYTRSEKLKNYFKAMMWYGRMSMLLKGGCGACLVSEEDARIQTMGAASITSQFAEMPDVKEKWDRIYSVTAFYVGLSDDLGPYEYIDAINKVFGNPFDPNDLTAQNVADLKAMLAEYRSPQIYGGTGNCIIMPPYNSEQADECLENTKGFRLMGQR
ncbi:MAG: DUF3160 domain-containing protein, partial [Candidatus Altiarchaeota archaeon]|nr:DUF3160 domain-containing protein [Candidatus Altiarchaeota archaeon]